MQQFLHTILSFPTVFFTVPMAVVLLYWGFVIVGAVDVDHGVDVNPDGALDGAHEGFGEFLHALRFFDAPVTVVVSLLSFWGWVLSFFGVTLGAALPLPAIAIQLAAFVVSLLGAVGLTSACLRPLAPLFKYVPTPGGRALLGKTCIVRSGVVDDRVGQIELDDGAAGLILNVRCDPAKHKIQKGDEVLLVDYNADEDIYDVEPMVALLNARVSDLEKVPVMATSTLAADPALEPRPEHAASAIVTSRAQPSLALVAASPDALGEAREEAPLNSQFEPLKLKR